MTLKAFIFQAADGIRDVAVTGVQTCALPISSDVALHHWRKSFFAAPCCKQGTDLLILKLTIVPLALLRSEERRVGKECRSRWWRAHSKKRPLEQGVRQVFGTTQFILGYRKHG